MHNISIISRLEAKSAAHTSASPNSTYRPLFYHLNSPDDQQRLEQLLAQQHHLQVFDQLHTQLEELVKSRRPYHKYQPAELQHTIQKQLGDSPPAVYGVWVYYPWSHRLVHLLDEPEFVELRTNRNAYKITPREQDQLAQQKIGVVGLSVGQAIAITIAMERTCGELRLADFDTLELSNLNRIRTGVHNLSVAKVIAAAREIAELDPFLTVRCYCDGVLAATIDTFLTDGGVLDMLIDECDSLDIKILLRQHAKAHRIPVVMDTSDRGLVDVERFDREPNRPIFHGLVGDLDYQTLQALSTEEKIPYILNIVGIETISPRMKASFLEVEQSIVTWPQLASSVVLGGAIGADICRRIALGQYHDSGRYFVDLETIIADQAEPRQESAITRPFAASITKMEKIALIEAMLDQAPHACAFPTRDQIESMIEAAIAAPSAANCQPWQWASAEGHLFLFHDECRSASWLDAGLAALGAAVENVVLRAHALDLEVALQYFPLPHDLRLVTTFCFASLHEHETDRIYEQHSCDALVDLIARRHTNRNLGARARLDPMVLPAIEAAVATIPGARLYSLESEGELEAIGEIIGAGDRLRLLHPLFHREMLEELRWTSEEAECTHDGVNLAISPLSATDRAGLEICRDPAAMSLLCQWNAGGRLKTTAKKAIAAAAAVAIITMPTYRPIDYVLGGRAMQRAWLVATQRNVALQPLCALPYMFAYLLRGQDTLLSVAMQAELYKLRREYQALFPVTNTMGEIMLFRLAVADPPQLKERRRPVRDVFRWFPSSKLSILAE